MTKSNESIPINLRAKARQRDLIDRAAQVLHRSRSEFMLEASCKMAEEVLLDQAFFAVDETTFERFQNLLDQPLPKAENLRRIIKTKAPWDK